MPIYDFECTEGCGTIPDVFAGVNQRMIPCPHCGADCKRLLVVNYSVHDDLDYFDETLGTHIKSRRHHRKVMREQGVAQKFGKGWY